jgi:hypothetical protein
MRTIYRQRGREAVWRPRSLRAGRQPSRRGLALEEREEVTARARECIALRRWERRAALHRERGAWVLLNTPDQYLEVKVRRRCETGHPDKSDGLTDRDSRAALRRFREPAEVPVASDEAVRMSDLDSVRSTAEHTWALLLALLRRVPSSSGAAARGEWSRARFLGELDGATLGIVGCGRLGRMVAGYGLAFGMRVLATELRDEAIARAPDGVAFVGIAELLAESDVVSLHLPLDATTTGCLSAARVAQM